MVGLVRFPTTVDTETKSLAAECGFCFGFRLHSAKCFKKLNCFSHSVGVSVMVNLHGEYVISEGGLPNNFRAAEFHFHWGSYDQQGAEHAIDGVFAPAEVRAHFRWHHVLVVP